jgi:hypothetical protein
LRLQIDESQLHWLALPANLKQCSVEAGGTLLVLVLLLGDSLLSLKESLSALVELKLSNQAV